MRILIVDDVPMNQRLLSAVLGAEKHQVLLASDGLEALRILEAEAVDAVISDILMPNMDGYRLCYEIRRNPKLRMLPLMIYTSTYTSDSDEKLALEAGADKYVRKPARQELLLQIVEEFRTDPKYKIPRPEFAAEQPGMMKAYSEALVRKLEHKNAELERAHDEIRAINRDLEIRVLERTADLAAANTELEAFGYSAAHDLRTPIRGIVGRCNLIAEDFGPNMAPQLAESIASVRASAMRMEAILVGLLKLSHIGKSQFTRQEVDVSQIARLVIEHLTDEDPERDVSIQIQPSMRIPGDRDLLQIAIQNLISNAWKFTKGTTDARIEFGLTEADGRRVLYVRDNGVGFDMAHANNLFSPFQRLHREQEFPGTGLGLTIVKRVVSRHGGSIWIESAPNHGTKVSFTLEES